MSDDGDVNLEIVVDCRHSYTFHPHSNLHMTPLEIGMYVLLAVFCAAISVFVATCIVYASRARKGQLNADDVVDFPRPSQPPQPPLPPTLSASSPLLDQFRNLFQKNKRPQDDNGDLRTQLTQINNGHFIVRVQSCSISTVNVDSIRSIGYCWRDIVTVFSSVDWLTLKNERISW